VQKTYKQQEIRDSGEMWASYYKQNNTGTSQTPKISNSTYWRKWSSKTRTREIYRKPARLKKKSKLSRKTCTRENSK